MCEGEGTARERFSAFEGVRAGAHEAPCRMAGLRLHHSPQIVRTGELARITTRGAREACVLALARCAAEVSAIPACQDRHGRWYGHREPPRILASRRTAGCAGASPGRGRAWQGLAGRTWARREGRRSTSAHRRPAQSPDVWCRASPGHRTNSRSAVPIHMARVPVQDGTCGYASAHQPRARRRIAGPSRALLGVVIGLGSFGVYHDYLHGGRPAGSRRTSGMSSSYDGQRPIAAPFNPS